MAYFGPNGNLIGNVRSQIWAYQKVENVGRLFFIQFLLFAIDTISVSLDALLLSKFGSVNLIDESCRVIKTHWIIFATMLANVLVSMFDLKDVNSALDMTMKFEWFTSVGRFSFISNSTDLSDEEKAFLLSNITCP